MKKGRLKTRKLLAAVLAVCMIFGSMSTSLLDVEAANGGTQTYAYQLSQDSLAEAIQEAVANGNTLDEALDFSGKSAGQYENLFRADGTLYELNRESLSLDTNGERDQVLGLRVFARVKGDIPEDGAYVADGSEEVLYLLQNKGSEKVRAQIQVDGKDSALITVLPADEVDAEKTASEKPAEETAEPETEEQQNSDADDEQQNSDSEEEAQIDDEASVDEEASDTNEQEAEPEEPETEVEEPEEEEDDEPYVEVTLKGTVYNPVKLGSAGAAAYAMTMAGYEALKAEEEAESEIQTLAEGDVYNVTYSANMSNVVTFTDAPETIADGVVLEFTLTISKGYTIENVTANDNTLAATDSDTDTGTYTYEYTGADGNGVTEDVAVEVTVYKGQVIDGYGQFAVTDQQTEEQYKVTIKDVPTNTPISLSYSDIEITDKDGEPVGATLTNRLYYVPNGASSTDDWEEVSYLMLNGSKKTGTGTIDGDDGSTTTITYYEVVPYGEDGAFDLTAGSLWLKNTTIISAKAEIMPIQTNTLCALKDDTYTQTVVGAKEMSSNPQVFYYPGYEDDYLELSRLTNGKDYKFYYGSLGEADKYGYKDISQLTECQYGQIVKSETTNDAGETIYEYTILPLDENFNVVENTNLYMEYDQVYSFDVEYESMVNEHTEDNGDVYLWMGTTYYVDKYHNQGTTTSNYTNTVPASGMGEDDLGIWVQLGKLREPLINKGTAFSTYESVTLNQAATEGVTQNIIDKVNASYDYGIAGPYTVDEGATAVQKYTTRVTGHVGDEFVASDVFDTEVVYLVTDKSELHETEWVDLGAHASDSGTRAWWYWINDFYRLNNYEDELEFLEIVEREDSTTGDTQIRLEADEMGESGLGEEYDVWSTELITKRNSVVETDLMTNPEKYETDGVGFSNIAGLPHHLQLRMNGTFETVDDQTGETYFGELTVIGDEDEDGNLGEKAPYIEYSIPAIYSNGTSAGTVTGSSYVKMENEQEAASVSFTDENGTNVYVPQDVMFDASQVVISVVINFEGTITSSSGETVTYTYDNPYTYTGTLTAAQLKEAYDTCPNNAGYDFAVNLSEAVHTTINTDTETIIYKVWDDNSNAYDSRGNVDGVVVTLERSKDGTEWETVMEKDDPTKAAEFTILPPLMDDDSEERDVNANQWSLVLTSDDLDLTYGEGDEEGYYEFRIATEAFKDGEGTSEDFTYNTIITGTSVTNTLLLDTLDITGEKLWEDAEGAPLEDIPVGSVIITLYQNGHYFGRQTVKDNGDSKWEFSFKDLPRWNGTEEYEYTLGEMMEDGTVVEDGQSVLLGNSWFHIEITQNTDDEGNPDGTYTFKNVENPENEKDVDADGDGEYGDTGKGVKVGDTVTYKIDYENYYPQEAKVVITDKVDEGLDFVEASDGGVYDEETRTITWTFESVAAKTSGSVTFSAVVNETALVRNEVDNTASVQVDDDPAVDTNTVYNPVPDKDVDADGDEVFEDSGMQVQVGDTLVYKIDYENPDDDPATVTITDEVDIGLDFVSATDDGLYDEGERLITWVIEDVDPHTNGSVYFTATVNEDALEKNYVENTATVQVGEHDAQQTKTVYNPIPGKDIDADGDGEYGDTGTGVKVGDTVTYKIDYVNEYPQEAKVVITDKVDEGLDFVEASDGGVYDEATRTITWTFDSVEAGTAGSVTFSAIVNETALVRNEIDNTAEVQVNDDPAVETNTVYNPVPDKDVDADGDNVFEDSGMIVKVGDTLTYKIDYENPDDDPATVTITDEVDQGLDFVSATDGGSYDDGARMITWTITDVQPHTNGSVYFTATVNENALEAMIVYNTAVVQVGNHAEQQTKTVNNPLEQDKKDVDADGNGQYGDSGKSVNIGDTLTYMITYYNEDEENPATVTITDVLDEGLDFVEASDGGTYDESTRTITWVIENVAAETGGSVTFSATVNGNALVKNEVENTAEIIYGDNPAVHTNTVYNPVTDKDVDADGDGEYKDSGMQVEVGDTLVYKIDYENPDDEAASVTITDEVDVGLDFASATDGGSYDDGARMITWVIENVAPHTNGSVYFTATVNETALVKNYVENTATVQVGEHDAQQTKTVYNPVPSKDVDADENHIYGDNGEEVYVGETLTYTINYFNGYDVEEEVFIEDKLDEGLTFVEASDGGVYDADTHTINWDIEHVEAHTAGAVTFSAVVNGSSLTKNEVDNVATVQIRNYSVQTNEVENPVPDKDVDADGDGTYGDNGLPVNVGDTLTYRIDYHNSYDDPTDVIITDTLDEGLDFVSADNGGTYDESTRTITWNIADADPHTSGNVTFQATVNDTALVKNEVENTATVQVGEYSQVTNTVHNPVPQKDVDIHGDGTYGDSGLKVSVGDELTYKIDYENPDDDPATVTITDVLDEGLDFVSADNGGTYEESNRTITWVIENVDAHTNGSVTFVATANEKALANGEVDNTATVQVGDHPEQQTNTVWNPLWEPEKSVDADGDGDFEDDGIMVSIGDELTYKITYKNYHDEVADVTITDELDEDVTFISATEGGLYDAGTHTVTWELKDVAAGYEGDVQFTVQVKDTAATKHHVDNTATVQVGNDSQVTNTVTNTVPDKDVDINHEGTYGSDGVEVHVGDNLTYRIGYMNGHDTEATITITDKVDDNLKFASATNGGTYDDSTRTITWTFTAAAGEEGYVEFTATVMKSALTVNEVDNTATVQVGNDYAVDTNTIHNPLWEPVKSVDVDGNGDFEDDGVTVKVGDELVYKVTYKNYHDTAETVTITDALDPNVEFVSATDGGTYDASTHTVTWTLNNVKAGYEGDVQFTVKVLSGAVKPGAVENTASVKVGNDDAMETNRVVNPVEEGPGSGTGTGTGSGNGGSHGPKTSDTNNIALWLMLLIASAAIVGVVWYRRRKAN